MTNDTCVEKTFPKCGRYVKLPCVIDAYHLGAEVPDIEFVYWAFDNGFSNDKWAIKVENNSWHVEIETLEGTMLAQPGDWIIKGVAGEFYPCKNDIFKRTYTTA